MKASGSTSLHEVSALRINLYEKDFDLILLELPLDDRQLRSGFGPFPGNVIL
jgi:hypothetical protein